MISLVRTRRTFEVLGIKCERCRRTFEVSGIKCERWLKTSSRWNTVDAKGAGKKHTHTHTCTTKKKQDNIAMANWASYNIETIAGFNHSKMRKT